MTQPAAQIPHPAQPLSELYALIGPDLSRVDAHILQRVHGEIPLIHDITRHIIAGGGKRIRPALTLISSQLCGYRGDRHIPLAAAVEFIHTATLLHDDVVDESKLRRGLATANEVFGNKASVLVGDFLLSQAFQLMVADGSLTVLRILSDASAVIAKGEVMQMMHEGQAGLAVEHYLEVIASKTAVLFASACELGAVLAGEEASRPGPEEALRAFGLNIGIAFQLVDDALDYAADQKALGKTVGDDFREGKVTLPVIIAYGKAADPEKNFWNLALGDEGAQAGDLEKALELIARHDGIAATLAMAGQYCDRARGCLADFPESPARSAMLDVVDFCASRAY